MGGNEDHADEALRLLEAACVRVMQAGSQALAFAASALSCSAPSSDTLKYSASPRASSPWPAASSFGLHLAAPVSRAILARCLRRVKRARQPHTHP